MIKATDIYTSVNKLLKSKYQLAKVLGHEIVEGFDKPAFFVDLRPKKITNDGVNFRSCSYTIQITYFPEIIDEVDNMTKADEIEELFGCFLTVSGRNIPITEYGYEFVGEHSNILQISVDIEYLDTVTRTDTSVTAGTLILNEEKR